MGRIFSVITACGALAAFLVALIVAGALPDDPSGHQVLAAEDRLHKQMLSDLAQQLEQRTARLRELNERLLALEQLLGTAQGKAGGASTLPLPVQEYLDRHIQSRWQEFIRPLKPVAEKRPVECRGVVAGQLSHTVRVAGAFADKFHVGVFAQEVGES